jgi:LPS export ABC transporter permease LptG/LPS export ABC transporter permease LptF
VPSLLDRYVVRETLLPLLLSLLLITFLLIIPPILQQGYTLIAQGVGWSVVVRVLVTLLPQALSVSIPMAVLMGLLIALGRLSADREFVAMQACGVSVYRLLRPVGFIAIVSTILTAYVLIVSLPNANQQFREITLREVSSLVENNVKPRVFFDKFPNRVLYVRDLPPGGGWRDIFLADSSKPGETTVYFAREGRILVDRAKQMVQLQLTRGTQHSTMAAQPDEYHETEFESISLNLDPQTVFPPPPSRGVPEMTIADLRRTIREADSHGDRLLGYNSRFMIQYKFSFPVACCVLSLVGLALGFSNRKDGKLASFVIGISVSFVYYVLLYMARAAAHGGVMSPDLAPWIPPGVLAVTGVALLLWRARSTDRPILITLPVRRAAAELSTPSGLTVPLQIPSPRPARVVFVIRLPHLNLRWPSILDIYTSRQYLRIFFLTVLAALGIFYVSTFIDLADKLFRRSATTSLLLQFFYYQTPQYVYYIIPIAGLVATLVTIGGMTKNSELIVIRACGVSLYRTAVPIVLFAVAASGVLFALQELVLARANEEAGRLDGIIRGYPAQTLSELNRWMASERGDVYHYDYFDTRANRFTRFTLYQLDQSSWRLSSVTYADSIVPGPPNQSPDARDQTWKARNGWVRTVTLRKTKSAVKTAVTYQPFAERELRIEPPSYFKTETLDAANAQKMTYGQLSDYIEQLRASGFNALPMMVQLQRKVAFPVVTIIMTLLAVPFAVTTGRRGALGGIGIGIAMSVLYWVILNVFSALGEGGVTTPLLAAWAPNILFGAAAVYMVLTVRT